MSKNLSSFIRVRITPDQARSLRDQARRRGRRRSDLVREMLATWLQEVECETR